MNDVLETLLIQLAAMQDAARAMVAAQEQPDAVWDWDGDHKLQIGLNETDDGGWVVGWLMRPGAYAYMVIEAYGRTPIQAALNLRTKMIEGK